MINRAAVSDFSLLAAKILTIAAIILGLGSCQLKPYINVPYDDPPKSGPAVPIVIFTPDAGGPAQLHNWAQPISKNLDIPLMAIEAYGYASAYERGQKPDCHLNWTTLAGIAAIETKHGKFHNSSIDSSGNVKPAIRGPVLNGKNNNMLIKDTDHGLLDGDPLYDRAMGPLQIVPETWVRYSVNIPINGHKSPDNIFDASLTAAEYLCANKHDLGTKDGWDQAILSYNNSIPYLKKVLDRSNAYAVGVSY